MGVDRDRAPAQPADPADPAYDFRAWDAAIAAARAKGLEPLLTVTGAPKFAEGSGGRVGPGRPMEAQRQGLRRLARAVAARYSGHFAGLSQVRYFQAWNEPNLSTYLTPQYKSKRSVAPKLYRKMLNQFYAGVKAVSHANVVVTGGTAPYGDPPGGDRTRPLTFWRSVLCLKGHKQPASLQVPDEGEVRRARAPPDQHLRRPHAPRPRSRRCEHRRLRQRLREILRAAKRHHTLGAKGHKKLWATEIWWSSKPPDPRGVKATKQARYVEQALYLLWRQGAKVVINLQVRDPAQGASEVYAGLYFHDGKPKPALQAFRFPFVADRASPARCASGASRRRRDGS